MGLPFRTDLEIEQLPVTYPNVGGLTGKNTIVTDPTFGGVMVRLTDSTCGLGNNESIQTYDAATRNIWNTNDTMIVVRDTGGNGYVFQFDPTTMQGTQLGSTSPYQIPGQYAFSCVSPGILFVCPGVRQPFPPASVTSGTGTVIYQLNFALVDNVWTYQSYSEVCDFANILPEGFIVDWASDFGKSQDDSTIVMSFSTSVQDTGVNMCIFQVGSGYRMLNTNTLQVTGQWGDIGTANLVNTGNVTSSFTIHDSDQLSNNAYSTVACVQLPNSTVLVWPNETLTLTCTGLGGHHCFGSTYFYTGNPGGGQLEQGVTATPVSPHTYVIPDQAGPPGLPAKQTPPQTFYGDEHNNFGPLSPTDESILWESFGPDVVYFPFTACWMGEIVGYDVSGAISGAKGTVYRLCHTFNSMQSPTFIVAQNIACPSQTGNFIAFTSDWGGSGTVGPLGSTAGGATGVIGGNARGDVFVLQTLQSTPTPPTPPNPPVITNVTSNNFGPFYQNTGTPPIIYGNPGVSPNNPWGFAVSGVDSAINTNIPETVPNPPAGGINNNPKEFN